VSHCPKFSIFTAIPVLTAAPTSQDDVLRLMLCYIFVKEKNYVFCFIVRQIFHIPLTFIISILFFSFVFFEIHPFVFISHFPMSSLRSRSVFRNANESVNELVVNFSHNSLSDVDKK
jgi:hypothetical protein